MGQNSRREIPEEVRGPVIWGTSGMVHIRPSASKKDRGEKVLLMERMCSGGRGNEVRGVPNWSPPFFPVK